MIWLDWMPPPHGRALKRRALPACSCPRMQGGFGGDWGDFFAVMRLAGETTLSLPIGETILATRLLADAGLGRADKVG
jgi:hypothetical protein